MDDDPISTTKPLTLYARDPANHSPEHWREREWTVFAPAGVQLNFGRGGRVVVVNVGQLRKLSSETSNLKQVMCVGDIEGLNSADSLQEPRKHEHA
jgi:hypothetical protein